MQIVFAEDFHIAKEEFFKAKVDEIIEEGEKDFSGIKTKYQKVKLTILDTNEKVIIDHGGSVSLTTDQLVNKGEIVVLVKIINDQDSVFQIIDKYRLDSVLGIIIIFLF